MKIKILEQHPINYSNQQCCICGSNNCSQSMDHDSIILEELYLKINQAKKSKIEIDHLKKHIDLFYQDLENKILRILRSDKLKMQQWINQFYFSHIAMNTKVQLLCEVLQNNFRRLPSKSIKKFIKISEACASTIFTPAQELQQVQRTIEDYWNSFNWLQTIHKIERQLMCNQIINTYTTSSHMKKHTSQISNPQQIDSILQYNWKNVRLTDRSKIVEMSNKNINDQQMMKQMPKLSMFKNLKDFEIRNNNITNLTCRLIANYIPFIKNLDIRGNNIDDDGILKIIDVMPNLRSLMISETKIGDKTAQAIVKKMGNLQMLWSQQTKITGTWGIQIAQLNKLKVLSLAGNLITSEQCEQIKKIFQPKGYVVI